MRLSAFAKINLSLEVIRRRDDGFHDIATILQTVGLFDDLSLSSADELSVTCDDESLSGETNIVWQTATALARYAGVAPAARIHITKRIPVAAGLGGGSADAAAALRGLDRLWDLHLPPQTLAGIASTLGSDVPFLLEGGTALATGRGDQISALPAPGELPVLLIVPAETIDAKTPTLYRALAPDDFSDGALTHRLAERMPHASITSTNCRNAFERSARAIFPGLADVWDIVAETTENAPTLSGAGPAIFCLPSSESEHRVVTAALRNTGATAYLVRTRNAPVMGNPTH